MASTSCMRQCSGKPRTLASIAKYKDVKAAGPWILRFCRQTVRFTAQIGCGLLFVIQETDLGNLREILTKYSSPPERPFWAASGAALLTFTLGMGRCSPSVATAGIFGGYACTIEMDGGWEYIRSMYKYGGPYATSRGLEVPKYIPRLETRRKFEVIRGLQKVGNTETAARA